MLLLWQEYCLSNIKTKNMRPEKTPIEIEIKWLSKKKEQKPNGFDCSLLALGISCIGLKIKK